MCHSTSTSYMSSIFNIKRPNVEFIVMIQCLITSAQLFYFIHSFKIIHVHTHIHVTYMLYVVCVKAKGSRIETSQTNTDVL
jgi:hypothetical protein